MKKRCRLLHCLNLVLFSAVTGFGADVRGQIQRVSRDARTDGCCLVWAEALEGPASPAEPRSYSMVQKNKSFVPRVMAVPAGSTVQFPNEDLIFHNVFSLSSPSPFDLGLYRGGASKSRLFSQPGTYRIFCNIHPEMSAILLVVSTSYITRTGPGGEYQFSLPAGRYRLIAWSDRSEPASKEVAVSTQDLRIPNLTLDETNFTERPHKNKFGQDYPKGPYDPMKGSGSRQ